MILLVNDFSHTSPSPFNSSPPGQDGRHVGTQLFKRIFLNAKKQQHKYAIKILLS